MQRGKNRLVFGSLTLKRTKMVPIFGPSCILRNVKSCKSDMHNKWPMHSCSLCIGLGLLFVRVPFMHMHSEQQNKTLYVLFRKQKQFNKNFQYRYFCFVIIQLFSS